MGSKAEIRSLTIAGFRGFINEQTFDLDRSPVLLLGENGSGKSSMLGAIEWCLFGDLSKIPQHRSSDQEDIQNPRSERLEVSLQVDVDDEGYRFSRLRDPSKKTVTELSIVLPSGETLVGEDANKRAFQLLRLTDDSFVRSVYLHQESIRDLITEDPRDRDEAMDRLLGLDGPKQLIEGLMEGAKAWKRESKRQQREFEELRKRIQGQLDETKTRLDRAKDDLAESGIDPEEADLEFGLALLSEATNSLNVLHEDVGLPELETPVVKDAQTLRGMPNWIKKQIQVARDAFPETEKIDSLVSRRTEAEELKSEYSGKHTTWNQCLKDLNELKQAKGDREDLESALNNVKERIEELDAQREQLGSKLRVIKDAIDYLQDLGAVSCPICGNQIEDGEEMAQHLHQELEELGQAELNQVDQEIEDEETRLKDVRSDLKRLQDLEGDEGKAKADLDETIVRISEFLGKRVDPEMDPGKKLSAEQGVLTRKINELREPLSKRENRIQAIEQDARKLEALAITLLERDRLDYLSSKENSEQMGELSNSVQEIEEMVFLAEEIVSAIGMEQRAMAAEVLESCHDSIQEYYERLCQHPHYDKMVIEVSAKELKSGFRNEYDIRTFNSKEKTRVSAAPKLSTGQLNSLALAVFLAMSMEDAYTHNLDLLIIDDPSQNLDRPHMMALQGILGEVAKGRNLIIASHDPEFQTILDEAHGSAEARKYRFGQYDPSNGPVLLEE